MADDVHTESSRDGLVATPVGIGYPGTEKRHAVLPELVEGRDTEGRGLALTESTRLLRAGSGVGTIWERLHNEVGDCKKREKSH